jgi:hypothetical protein
MRLRALCCQSGIRDSWKVFKISTKHLPLEGINEEWKNTCFGTLKLNGELLFHVLFFCGLGSGEEKSRSTCEKELILSLQVY